MNKMSPVVDNNSPKTFIEVKQNIASIVENVFETGKTVYFSGSKGEQYYIYKKRNPTIHDRDISRIAISNVRVNLATILATTEKGLTIAVTKKSSVYAYITRSSDLNLAPVVVSEEIPPIETETTFIQEPAAVGKSSLTSEDLEKLKNFGRVVTAKPNAQEIPKEDTVYITTGIESGPEFISPTTTGNDSAVGSGEPGYFEIPSDIADSYYIPSNVKQILAAPVPEIYSESNVSISKPVPTTSPVPVSIELKTETIPVSVSVDINTAPIPPIPVNVTVETRNSDSDKGLNVTDISAKIKILELAITTEELNSKRAMGMFPSNETPNRVLEIYRLYVKELSK